MTLLKKDVFVLYKQNCDPTSQIVIRRTELVHFTETSGYSQSVPADVGGFLQVHIADRSSECGTK